MTGGHVVSFLTREMIEKILPKSIRLDDKAQRIVGVPKKDPKPLEACLIWLAGAAEDNKIDQFSMTHVPEERDPWFVIVDGRELISASQPTLAALRAVIVLHCRLEWRALPPDERPDFVKYIERFMAE